MIRDGVVFLDSVVFLLLTNFLDVILYSWLCCYWLADFLGTVILISEKEVEQNKIGRISGTTSGHRVFSWL